MRRFLERNKRRLRRLFGDKVVEVPNQLTDPALPAVLSYIIGTSKNAAPDFKDERWKKARAAYLLAQKQFWRAAGEQLRFQRVLGMGGYGMAQLVRELRDSKGLRNNLIVNLGAK